jgi:hypothetical protein
MPFVRRTVAVLSSLFLLQLSLLGSGTLCTWHHGAARIDRAGHSMHGMSRISAPEKVVSAAADGRPASPSDSNGPTDHDGCRLPWAPGQCGAMATCGVTATPAAPTVASWIASTASIETVAPALARSGPTFAPELPPPRV